MRMRCQVLRGRNIAIPSPKSGGENNVGVGVDSLGGGGKPS